MINLRQTKIFNRSTRTVLILAILSISIYVSYAIVQKINEVPEKRFYTADKKFYVERVITVTFSQLIPLPFFGADRAGYYRLHRTADNVLLDSIFGGLVDEDEDPRFYDDHIYVSGPNGIDGWDLTKYR